MRKISIITFVLLIAAFGLVTPGEAIPPSLRLGQALTKAAWNLDLVKVTNLLEQGADPNARRLTNYTWQTPITAALSRSESQDACLPVLECLAAHGADVNRRDGRGDTPLTLSAGIGSTRVIRFLISHGANVNARDSQGRTALSYTANDCGSCGCDASPENGELLGRAGADVNSADRTGTTPLMYLVSLGDDDDNLDFVRFLLEHGANPKLRDGQGRTALQIARTTEKEVGNTVGTIRLLKEWIARPHHSAFRTHA